MLSYLMLMASFSQQFCLQSASLNLRRFASTAAPRFHGSVRPNGLHAASNVAGAEDKSCREAPICTDLHLLDLGALHSAVIVSRPSGAIKSPYIADIMTLADSRGALPPELSDFKAASTRAGQRALDAARVDGLRSYAGSTHLAHAPALDCAGMVVPGAIVQGFVHCSANDLRRKVKTAFTIQLCEELREDGVRVLVGYYPASIRTC